MCALRIGERIEMSSFDPVAWGWGFVSTGIAIGTFILTILVKRLPTLVSVIGFLVVAGLVVSGVYLLASAWKSSNVVENEPKHEPTNHGVPSPPALLPETNLSEIARARMFWGTMPPNGDPTIVYSVSNTSARSLNDVSASAWIVEGQSARKLDERQIGYIGQGESREARASLRSTPYGRGLLCVSFMHDGRTRNVLHFFQNIGEYAKYGPMREMQRFRDPTVGNDGLCRSVATSAAALIAK
jgi:hypothetical protein